MWCGANYVPLTPLSFLERAAVVYGDRTAVVCGDRRFSWRETRKRCLAGASALAHLGIGRRDVVSHWRMTSCLLFRVMRNGW
jgi:non-ribosomal peptide synthetase component E (peptide arylation enzyme)